MNVMKIIVRGILQKMLKYWRPSDSGTILQATQQTKGIISEID